MKSTLKEIIKVIKHFFFLSQCRFFYKQILVRSSVIRGFMIFKRASWSPFSIKCLLSLNDWLIFLLFLVFQGCASYLAAQSFQFSLSFSAALIFPTTYELRQLCNVVLRDANATEMDGTENITNIDLSICIYKF